MFGVFTRPVAETTGARDLPVFVFLSAGLLHRVGPMRLYVRLARELATLGFSSLRVDLSGIGDSPRSQSPTNQHAVTTDYEAIVAVLESRLGTVSIILGGLCSAADNGIRLTAGDPRVVGMLLLDPVCFAKGFRRRKIVAKYADPRRYIGWLKRQFRTAAGSVRDRRNRVDLMALRDIPTDGQLQAAFAAVRERGGRVLTVFSQHAFDNYCDQRGHLARTVGTDGYERFCTELLWPHAEHEYMLDVHRRQLIDVVRNWAAGYLHAPGQRASADSAHS